MRPCAKPLTEEDVLGDFVVDSYIHALPRRYGAEAAAPQLPPLQPRPGHALAK